MTGHEKILYTVDKVSVNLLSVSHFDSEVITRYLFRTRLAARRFVEQRNKGSRKYTYKTPRKAYWGPDN